MLVNAPSWAVVGANFDQAVRNGQLDERTAMQIGNRIEGAMHLEDVGANPRAIQARLESAARMVPDSAPYLQRALEEFADNAWLTRQQQRLSRASRTSHPSGVPASWTSGSRISGSSRSGPDRSPTPCGCSSTMTRRAPGRRR